MTELKKIDTVLKFIIECEQPPKRKATEIDKELDFKLTTKERIEILDKLKKDGFVISEMQADNVAYYFSSFEGRLHLKNGGYSKSVLRQTIKTIANKSIIAINVIIAFIIIWLTYLNYKATNKSNDNKEEITKLNSAITNLTKSNDSLKSIIYKGTTQKK